MTKRFTLSALIYCGIVVISPSLAMAGNTGGGGGGGSSSANQSGNTASAADVIKNSKIKCKSGSAKAVTWKHSKWVVYCS